MIAARLREIALSGNAEPRAQRLQQNRHQIRKQNDAQQRVAESRTAGQIGRPVSWIHVTDRDEITGTGKREKLSPKSCAGRNRNRAMRFRQTRRSALYAPSALGRKLFVHSEQFTCSRLANKIDILCGGKLS